MNSSIQRELYYISDCLISNLRSKLGLWFDICENVNVGQCVNSASITNGETTLVMYFYSSQNELKTSAFLGAYNGKELHIHIDYLYGSKIVTPIKDILNYLRSKSKDIILSECEQNVSLLSFEFTGSNRINLIKEHLLNQDKNLTLEKLPVLMGSIDNEKDYTILEDDYACWGQLNFTPSIKKESLRDLLKLLISQPIESTFLSAQYHDVVPELINFGFRKTKILIRYN